MEIISTNPSRNYEVIGSVRASTEQEIEIAVEQARKAQPAWAALGQVERNAAVRSFMDICRQYSEEIAVLVSKEMGMPISRSRAQVVTSFDFFNTYMEIAERALAPEIVFENATERHHQTRETLGVIACITPWNFPFLNIPWQAGQALLAGNTILYKPSEEIILFGELIAELVQKSELPKGVFTVVHGDGSVGELLIQQQVDAILFTGSTQTGQRITELAAKTSTRVLAEMGGSAAGIVFDDADIPKIINTLYAMRFYNTGQFCDGLKRLLVHESRVDEILSALQKVNSTTKVGDSLDEHTRIGPLAAKRQLDLLESQVRDALDKGATVLFGGKKPKDLQGAYYEPTVLANVTFDMRVWAEETFGPILPVVSFKTEQEAVRFANDTKYGLAGFVFTENKDRYLRIAKQLSTSPIAHNNALFYSPTTPFGGYKASGNSQTNGIEGFHEVTQVKLISEEK